MPNQMIALQARNPQLPDPSRQTAQFANMMNMSRQAEAAQLQGQRIRQEMDYARAGEERAKQTQTASMRASDQTFMVNDMKRLRNIGVAVLGSRSEEGYQSWVDMVEATDSQLGATIRQVAPNFDPNIMNYLIAEADKYIEKNIPQRTSKSEFDANGNLIVIDQGGFDPAKIRAGVITNAPDMARPQTLPPATPTAPQASAMERDPSAASGAAMTFGSDATRPLNEYQQEDLRRLEGEPGMKDTAASFTDSGMGAGPMTPERAQQIVDSAVRTRVMAQADFDQLMAMAPEQNKQPFMDMIRSNNITLQAGGMGQQPQSQFADLRGAAPQSQTAGLRGAPPMEQTLAQYQIGQQVKGKNPNLSPAPAEIPLSRRGAEARVERITSGETGANTLAQEQAKEAAAAAAAPALAQRERNVAYSKERGTADAKFMESAPAVIEASTDGRNILNQMIGDAYVNKQGKITVPKGGSSPHAGFESVVGLGFPGMRFVPGSQSADFDRKFKQVLGKSFLKAFNDLRGGGSITEIEGVKATEAITRLSRFSSEVEFIRAARELEDILAKGEQRALDRRARIEGKSAPRVSTSTSKKSNPRELRFDPATGGFN